ncbi:MAG: SWIM zinc finger family protein [Saprospiraceae bacterium]|nr:SWIM zinc finger family protein [Saprospiraceae bacterium]
MFYWFIGMNMNFPLQHIESNLDEDSLLQGEQFLDEGRVQNLQEAAQHLWLAQVQDDQIYEVEVKISPSKVKAVSCECERFQKEKECGHIAAVLLQLRNQLSKSESQNIPEEKEEDAPKRLTTGVVLDQVNFDELVTFVKQYAKTNRNFALALKARFAPGVTGIDSREKYLQLLESTIAASRRPDRTFNQRGANNIYKILLEIHSQIQEAIVQGYLAEAVVMAQSMIEKITPLLRKMQALQEEVREQVREAFEVFRMVLELSPPPSLRESIWAYCHRECRKLLYRNMQIDQYFLRILVQMTEDEEKTEQLLALLDEQMTRYLYEKREQAQLILLKLTLLEKLNRVNDIHDFLNQHITNDEVLFFAIRQSINRGNFQRAKTLAQSGQRRSENTATTTLLDAFLLEIAEREGDSDAIVRHAEQRLLQTLDLKYYKIINKAFQGNWKDYYTSLLNSIRQLPFSIEKFKLIAAIYYEEGQYQDLLKFLRETQSLDLAQAYGHLLLPYERDGVYHFYFELIEHYLNNHIGRKPSEKIRAIIRQLYEADAEDLADSLVENLRANYPERHSLMEELELF